MSCATRGLSGHPAYIILNPETGLFKMIEVFIFAIITFLVLWHINMPDMKKVSLKSVWILLWQICIPLLPKEILETRNLSLAIWLKKKKQLQFHCHGQWESSQSDDSIRTLESSFVREMGNPLQSNDITLSLFFLSFYIYISSVMFEKDVWHLYNFNGEHSPKWNV